MVGRQGQRATIRDVAALAGVAVGTVSRVLNGHKSVTAEARERVQQAIAQLGYQRDAVAGSMRSGQTGVVACAVRDYDFASYVKAAEEVFKQAGYILVIASTSNDKAVEIDLLRNFAQRRIDGVMMTMSNESDPELVAAILNAPMPVILIDRESLSAVDRVMADHLGGARQATEYLLSLGHRRVGLIVGDPNAYPSRGRIEGYGEAHAAKGVPLDDTLIRRHVLTNEIAFRETFALLSAERPPTAIFVAAMDMLPGAIRAVRASGRVIGKDIAIVAGSDSDLAELGTPPITALSWDNAEMGRQAATMLLRRIRGQSAEEPQCVRFPVSLVVRASTAGGAAAP